MAQTLKKDIKRIISLILTVAMVLGANTAWSVNNVRAEEADISNDIQVNVSGEEKDTKVEETNKSDDSQVQTPVIDDVSLNETAKSADNDKDLSDFEGESIEGERVEGESIEGDTLTSDDKSLTVEAEDDVEIQVEDDETIQVEGDYTTIDKEFGIFLNNYMVAHYDDEKHINVTFQKDSGNNPIYTSVSISSIQSITKLTIDSNDKDASDTKVFTETNIKDLTALSEFTNLKSLTIKGLSDIQQISFPSSLESLTIQDCKFTEWNNGHGSQIPCIPDISGCTNLEELTFKKNKRGEDGEIEIKIANGEGGGACSLQKAVFDGSNVVSIAFPANASGNLKFSAKDCTKLGGFSLGGYTLINGYNEDGSQYAPSFRGCTSLDSLTVKGIADKESQTFNIDGCNALATIIMEYYFTNEKNRLTISADNIEISAEDGRATFSRTSGSAAGKYIMSSIKDSYLDVSKWGDTNSSKQYFDTGSSSADTGKAAAIVFEQDKARYYDNRNDWFAFEFWKIPKEPQLSDYDGDTTKYNEAKKEYEAAKEAYKNQKRNYEANPIILRVGESINNNTPNFYSNKGINLNSKYGTSEYTVSVEDRTHVGADGEDIRLIPTTSELSNAGIAEKDYHVISYSASDRALKVTAQNPGIAYLTVTTADGNAVSETQKIIVLDTITSMTLEECNLYSSGYDDDATVSTGDNRVDTQYFYVTYETKYPSLSKYIEVRPEWHVWKKGSSGYDTEVLSKNNTGNTYKYATDDGIKIWTSAASNKSNRDESTGEWRIGYEVIICDNACGGEYSIRGEVYDNKCLNRNGTRVSMSTTGGTDPVKLTVHNFATNGNELGYGITKTQNIDNFTATSVEYVLTTGAGYREDDTPKIVGNANDCLTLVEDPKDSGKYTLKFNIEGEDAKTSAQIAKFLQDKGSYSNCYVDVVTKLGKDKEHAKTYTKRVYLAGKFKVDYELDGGTGNNNITEYYIPSMYPQKYNFTGDLSLKPVTKVGYDFMGWYDAAEDGNKITKIASSEQSLGNLKLYAHWKGKEYTVSFNGNGGTFVGAGKKTVTFGEEYDTLPTPTWKGHTFVGWYTEKECEHNETECEHKIKSESPVNIASNHTLYARWVTAEYKVTLNPNGGRFNSGSGNKSFMIDYGTKYGDKLLNVTHADDTDSNGYKYAFAGWYTDAGKAVTENDICYLEEDTTLYAQWVKYPKRIANVKYSLPSGDVEKGTKISLSCDDKNCKILAKTTDLSKEECPPLTIEDNEYSDCFVINENTKIWARTYKEYDDNTVAYGEPIGYTFRVKDESWGDVEANEDDKALYENANEIPTNLWVVGVLDQNYCGKAITFPDMRVYYHNKLLKNGTDYTVKYANNVKAGTATVTITGKGNYSGTIVKSFTINPLNISAANANDILLAFNNKVQKGTTAVTYVIDGKTVTLKANTDFTFVYPKTNSKASDYDPNAFKVVNSDGSDGYEIQIVGKGNYTGTKTINEKIVDVPLLSKMTVKGVVDKPYSGAAITQDNLEVWNGKVKLPEEEYTVVGYDNNIEIGTATVTIAAVEGSTKCIGTKTVTFKITGTELKKATFGKEVTNSYSYTGEDIEPLNSENSVTYVKDKVSISLKGIEKSDYDSLSATNKRPYDYTYEYVGDTINIGTVKVVFTGVNGYYGTVTKSYKIVGVDISKMLVVFDADQTYDGEEKTPEVTKVYQKATSKTPERVFEKNTDYTISYENNINASKKATIIIKGVNGCTGTIKKTFTIKPKPVTGFSITVDSAVYQKGGSKPAVTLKDGSKELNLGTDYTVAYSNNSKVHDGIATKTPTVKITGKGNYTGILTKTYAIDVSNLDNVSITASDITYQKKAGICKPTIKLIDSDGKTLVAGTDYEKNIKYTYSQDVAVMQVLDAKKKTYTGVVREKGDDVDPKDIIPTGTDITAEVTGKGNYPGSKKVSFRYVQADISKASVSVAPQYYTGKEITLSKDNITIKVGKTVLEKTDYEIVGYRNNTARGTAEVTIRGIGGYGGTKTAKFNIVARTMNFIVVYNKNANDATGTMKNSVIAANAKVTANAFKRNGYSFAGWSTTSGTQPVEIYNSKALTVSDAVEYGSVINLYAQWTPVTYTIKYTLNGGTNSSDNPSTYTVVDSEIELDNPTKTGYTFGGWYLDTKFTALKKVTSIPTGTTGNKVLYAKWIKQ